MPPQSHAIIHIAGINQTIEQDPDMLTKTLRSIFATTRNQQTTTKPVTLTATPKPTPAKSPKPAHPQQQPVTRQQVADLAYRLWHDQGKPDGMAQAHWQQAEQQLKSNTAHA